MARTNKTTLRLWIEAAFISGLLISMGAGASTRVEIILDASGSMWGQVGGEAKITAAKRVVHDWLTNVKLPADTQLGLTVYGHRSKADCRDIERFTPVTYDRHALLFPFVAMLSPKGKTPIADTLTLVGETLKEEESQASILLVSDGIESCDGDPCGVARRLRDQYGINVTIHVVGFNITEGQDQLQCIAREGGGKYFSVANGQELAAAFEDVKSELIKADMAANQPVAPPPKVKMVHISMERGTIKLPGLRGRIIDVCRTGALQECTSSSSAYAGNILPGPDALSVPAGTYRLKFDNVYVEDVDVKAGQPTVVEIGVISIPNFRDIAVPVCQENSTGECNSNSTGYVGEIISGTNFLVVPPGTYKIKFTNQLIENITVEPGQTVELHQ